ncbi:hypothetical protein Cgig2_021950 [Carnegiea gigantea]|uniref:Fatty acid desaturase domain-containing protein n=1 Tax=Carnegiea gigantea TaxID=171969 RepID=A0A9Q1KTF4_9CARY|nr:hypothetical protein Cgig2_021950 [Carnegiea gigantea]
MSQRELALFPKTRSISMYYLQTNPFLQQRLSSGMRHYITNLSLSAEFCIQGSCQSFVLVPSPIFIPRLLTKAFCTREDSAASFFISLLGLGRSDFVVLGKEFPFKLADVRAAIPKHCWVKDPWKSMSYVVRDLVILGVFGLFYWFAQGTMFWALFVLGHDYGHGSCSNSKKLNSVVGHIVHTSILVPYHGWRISHRIHHANHAHVENDESWRPVRYLIFLFIADRKKEEKFNKLSYPKKGKKTQ